jgi:hypothetical protein
VYKKYLTKGWHRQKVAKRSQMKGSKDEATTTNIGGVKRELPQKAEAKGCYHV